MNEAPQPQEDLALQERCRALVEVVERFLKRQASIGELRAAVKALRGARDDSKQRS